MESEVGGGKNEKMGEILGDESRSFMTAGEKLPTGSLCEVTPGCWSASKQLIVSSI